LQPRRFHGTSASLRSWNSSIGRSLTTSHLGNVELLPSARTSQRSSARASAPSRAEESRAADGNCSAQSRGPRVGPNKTTRSTASPARDRPKRRGSPDRVRDHRVGRTLLTTAACSVFAKWTYRAAPAFGDAVPRRIERHDSKAVREQRRPNAAS
jgi:hypothetical protein